MVARRKVSLTYSASFNLKGYEMKASLEIKNEILANATIGFIEAGLYSDWCGTFNLLASDPVPEGEKWYAVPELYNENLRFHVVYDGANDEEGTYASEKELTFADIQKGLELMAEGNAYQFGLLTSENDDAITHDVLWQFIILGEEIYG